MKHSNRRRQVLPPWSSFAGVRFPPDVIMVAERLYLRYNLSYRDVEELLIERGVEVLQVVFERYADDAVVHCRSESEARRVLADIGCAGSGRAGRGCGTRAAVNVIAAPDRQA